MSKYKSLSHLEEVQNSQTTQSYPRSGGIKEQFQKKSRHKLSKGIILKTVNFHSAANPGQLPPNYIHNLLYLKLISSLSSTFSLYVMAEELGWGQEILGGPEIVSIDVGRKTWTWHRFLLKCTNYTWEKGKKLFKSMTERREIRPYCLLLHSFFPCLNVYFCTH